MQAHKEFNVDEAERLYRVILAATPHHHVALHLLGVLDHQRGQHETAIVGIRRAIALDSSKPAYHNNLGVALRAAGRLDEALAAYREAVRLSPAYSDALANLAVALHELGRTDEAIPHFEAALRLKPDHADALYNLANLLHGRGQSAQAVPYYQRAHQAAPDRSDILNNAGNALSAADRPDEALAAYRRATEVDASSADAWTNLGGALAGLDRVDEAADALAAAARLRPDEAHWPIRIAALCPSVFPDNAAIDRYRVGLEAVLDANRAGVRLKPGGAVASGCHPPFNLSHHGRDDRPIKAKFAALFRDAFPDRQHPRREGPPRIGFVATHPREGMFLRCNAAIIDGLDPQRFRVVVFGDQRGLPAMRAALRRPDAEFVAIPPTLPAAADRIAEARCDVLYHWQIGSDPLNYFLPFARPAPVQCTSWGTHTTSGVPAVDFFITSALVEAPGAEAHYSEALAPLDSLLCCRRTAPPTGPPPRRAEFGLPEGPNLYACLQRLQKIHPDFDARLAAILRLDPDGLIVLVGDRQGQAAARLADRFRATMPDVADRIAFVPRQPGADYLRLLSMADVALDPPHFGSGATAYDAFALGVPLVTLPGAFLLSRYASACCRKVGVPELVADSPGHYAEIAARVARDREYRADVSSRISAAGPALFEDTGAVREHGRFFERAASGTRG